MQRGLHLAGVFCACPALLGKGPLRARPPAQISLVPGKSAASPAIISAYSFVSGGRTSITDVSEEAAARQASVTGLTHPSPRGWVGLSVQMALSHVFCSVLGCTHRGLEATHTHCLTVLEAGAWNQGVRAVSCWRVSGRNSCLSQLQVPQGSLFCGCFTPSSCEDTCHNNFTCYPDPL